MGHGMERVEGGIGVPLHGCGAGLHREHHDFVLDERPDLPFFEVISENFFVDGGRPLQVLDRVRSDWPLALHGVSLSPGSAEPARSDYLDRLATLVARVEPAVVSDHLCWTGLGGHNSHDLLPMPFTEEAVRAAAANIRRVQDRLGRRILVENVSTYLRFDGATLTEWEFVSAVLEESGCGLLLDVNNVYVNSRNHGFDPRTFFEGIPRDRVGQFHVAGHEDRGSVIVDTHDRPVAAPVWDLFRAAVERFGPLPTIIERDDDIPEFPVVWDEARRAQGYLDAARR